MNGEPNSKKWRAKLPGLVCAFILCGILVAGLYPFRAPRNTVSWLEDENGLRFTGDATIWSTGSFQTSGPQDENLCSIELWLLPSVTNQSNTIFSFSTAETPVRLSVYQYRSTLIVRHVVQANTRRNASIGLDAVFRQIRPLFITLTSGDHDSEIYVDGVMARKFPRFRFGDDCAGQLVIGTSPIDDDNWPGEIHGIAIYRQQLSDVQVLQHYLTWTTQGRPALSDDDRAVALYLFDERAGNIAHNSVPGGLDLRIPERYFLVHQRFLEPFWQEYQSSWEQWKDILVNVVGFMPLGFFFCAYWLTARPVKRALLVTIGFGFAVSLTIEVLQGFLPTRNSGTTDLITNTLGTFLGAWMYNWKFARNRLGRIYGW